MIVATQSQANAINAANDAAWNSSDAKAMGWAKPAPIAVGDRVEMLSDGQGYLATETPRVPVLPTDYDEQSILDGIANL